MITHQHSWLTAVENFTHAPEGNRNNTLLVLAREGRWREMDNHFHAGETETLLIKAVLENGLPYQEALATIKSARQYAEGSWVPIKGNGGGGSKPYSDRPYVTALCNTSQAQRYVDAVSRTNLADNYKLVIYVLAARALVQGITQKFTARTLAKACGVQAITVSRALRAAHDAGWVVYLPGTTYAEGGHPSAVTLPLMQYAKRPVDEPLVKLDDYAERAAQVNVHITKRRTAIKAEQTAHMKAADESCMEPEPIDEEQLRTDLRKILGI